MRIANQTSRVLHKLSFLAACCVVLIHSNSICFVANPNPVNLAAHEFVCYTLTKWAVPYFFACSGFFFALSDYVAGGEYYAFILKKVRSILVPYFLWALIATIVVAPLVFLNNRITGRLITDRTVFSAPDMWSFCNQLLGILPGGPMHLGVLWFLRSLFVLFLLAPIWRFFAQKKYAWLLIGVAVVIWLFVPDISCPNFEFLLKKPAFFFLGIAIAAYCPKYWLYSEAQPNVIPLPKFVNYTFWLYCTHNIILNYLLAFGHFVFGKTNLTIALLTPVSFISTIILSIILAEVVKQFWPRTFVVLNGGRK